MGKCVVNTCQIYTKIFTKWLLLFGLSQVTGVAFDPWKCDEKVYRIGSVGEDCNLILWDFSVSALHRPRYVSTWHANTLFYHVLSTLITTHSMALRNTTVPH